MSKIAILPSVALKLCLGSKSFRNMTPTKVGFLRLTKVLGAEKSFWAPQNLKK